jgi:hypothetical protein
MVIVLVGSAVDRGFKPRSGQTKHYKIGICCFSNKHAALRRKGKDWLVWNWNNVSEWSGLEPTIYRTPDEHNNHYATDAVVSEEKINGDS